MVQMTVKKTIRWILHFYEDLIDYFDKDASYICYSLGLGYDKEYLFKPNTNKRIYYDN